MIIPLRLSIFVVMLVAIHINTNIKNRQSHHKILTLLLSTYLLHCTLLIPILIISNKLLYIDLANPFGLLYGPLLFFYYMSINNRKLSRITIYLNLIPIIISWIAYFIFILNESIRIQTASYYYPVLYCSIGVSLILYSLYIILDSKNKDHLFSFFLILAGVFLMYLSIKVLYKNLDSVVSEDVVSNLIMTLFMLIGGLLLFDLVFRLFKSQYYIKQIRNNNSFHNMNYGSVANNERFIINSDLVEYEFNKESYINLEKEILENLFITEHIVDKTMDLSKAASILKMSQNKLQNFIYDYYGSTFSKVLTLKRVEYACKLIQENGTSEIPDNLYELCGFNSISTFYRNFKTIVGCSPSHYKS